MQFVLLATIEAGRTDIACIKNRRWLMGALRKRALFDARATVRRRNRERSIEVHQSETPSKPADFPARFVRALSPRLRTTALLALSGHSKVEIAWLLKLSDPALRQRIAEIRKRWYLFGSDNMVEFTGLNGEFAFGRMRAALLKPVRHAGAVLASHDTDGHLFIVSSQNGASRQPRVNSTKRKE